MRAVASALLPQHMNMPRCSVPQCKTEEWRQILQIPSKTVRDLASIIACPQLLQTSSELPLVPDAVFGTRDAAWERSLNWLESLDPAEVDAWFAAKQRTRLGYRFADCVEYNLRFSPIFHPPCLDVSQQVFQWTARNPAIPPDLSAAKEGSPAERHLESENEDAFESGCDALGERADYGLVNLLNEAIEGASDERFGRNENELFIERVSNVSLEEGIRDSLPVGRKKSRRLQRKAAKKTGKTVTVGEFDILFLQEQSPATVSGDLPSTGLQTDQREKSRYALGKPTRHESSGAEGKEKVVGVEHWELSVKFLLYIGPPKKLLEELGRAELVLSLEQSDVCSGVLSTASIRKDSSLGGGSADQDRRGSEALKSVETEGNSLQQRCNAQYEACHGQEEDLLYHFVGPHAGERLSDRKDRIAKQLCLSDDPLAKQVLADLFLKPSKSESVLLKSESPSSEVDSHLTSEQERQPDQTAPLEKPEPSKSEPGIEDREQVKLDGEARDAELMEIEVTPRAFVKGYLFYEHQLWKVLAGRGQPEENAIGEEPAIAPDSSPSLEASKVPEDSYLSSDSSVSLGTGVTASREARRAEATQTAPSTFSKPHLRKGACLDAMAGSTNNLEDPLDAPAAVPQKARLNPSHWIGWWTRDIRAFLEDPIFSVSRWYIIPKMEWLSPVVVRESAEASSEEKSAVQSCKLAFAKEHSNGRPLLSNKCTSTALTPVEQAAADRQMAVEVGTNGRDHSSTRIAAETTSKKVNEDIDALSKLGARSGRQSGLIEQASQVLTSAELLTQMETLHAVAKRCKVPRRGRVLVAELQWESTGRTRDKNSKQGEEKGSKEGAWVEVSRGFVVESTWPETGELPCIMLP